MHFTLTHSTPETTRLILLFAGWGATPWPLQGVAVSGYDTAVVWSHTDRDDSKWIDGIKGYREIILVGWSYGVNSAARWIATHPELPVTAKIAVNGTLYPASDTMGIPGEIFLGTLENLSERSVEKFMMRMCGGVKAYKEYCALSQNASDNGEDCQRSIEDLRAELQSFGSADTPGDIWDIAIVSDDDHIIPPGNQRECWLRHALNTISLPGPHFPDFNALLRKVVTDKGSVGRRFHRAEDTYDANAAHQHKVINRALELAGKIALPKGGKLLEIGCGTGLMTQRALELFLPAGATLIDLHITPRIREIASQPGQIAINIIEDDAETAMTLLPPESFDIVISASTIQWFNSARSFFTSLSKVMKHGGIAVVTTYGPDTMHEINETLGSGRRFMPLDSLIRALPAETFELIHSEEAHDTLTFPSPLDVLRHVSRTGVNATGADGDTAAAIRIMRHYPTTPEGEAPVTYHPIYLILRRK